MCPYCVETKTNELIKHILTTWQQSVVSGDMVIHRDSGYGCVMRTVDPVYHFRFIPEKGEPFDTYRHNLIPVWWPKDVELPIR